VDLWARKDGQWRLESRYAASVAAAAVPGWKATPVIEKK
jgi:hypothetical protein